MATCSSLVAASTVASCNSFSAEASKKLSALSNLQRSPLCRPVRLSSSSRAPRRRRALPKFSAKQKTFSSFEDLLENSDTPVLVDFYATWCGPCQLMFPVLEEVSARMEGVIQVVKIDTEKYPNIASRYAIEALPTFIVFRDGRPCYRFEGALPADKLIQLVEDALKVAK